MISLLPPDFKSQTTKKHLVSLERTILETLQFSVQWAGPTPFLDRYVRMMGLESEPLVLCVSRELCRSLTTDTKLFLTLRPSEVAAAALLMTLNLSQNSKVCKAIGINCLKGKVNAPGREPLSWWTPEMQALCPHSKEQLASVYTSTLQIIDSSLLNGALQQERALWP